MGGLRARGRRLVVRVVGAVMAATGLVAVVPGPAHAADWWTSSSAQWYDGGISYSSVVNCPSMIFGSPYYENGIGAFASYAADPDNARPAVGDTTFIKYSIYGMGNPCSGGTYFTPTFYLPAGMTFDTSLPITCTLHRNNTDNRVQAPVPGCPGWSNVSQVNANTFRYFNNESGSTGSLWGVAQGQNWSFQLPVKVNQALSGAPLQMHLTLADGNFNPTVLIETPVYVFASGGSAQPAGVMYEQPSTRDLAGTKYGVETNYQAVVNHKFGTAKFEISTSPTMASLIGTHSYSWNTDLGTAVNVGTYWDPAEPGSSSTLPTLQPGVTYYWRGVVTLTGQAPMVGAVQSFRIKPGGGVDASGTLTPGAPSDPGQGGSSGSVGGSTLTPTTQTPAPPPPPPPAPGVTATATATVARTAKAAKGVKVTISCTGACTAKAAATVSKKISRKLGVKKGSLGTGTATLSAAGSKVVTIKLSRAVQKKLKKLKKVAATVAVTTTAGGASRTTTTKVVIKG